MTRFPRFGNFTHDESNFMETKNSKDPRNAFGDLVAELRDGDAQFDASDALNKLLTQIRETCQPGSISLKISFKPAGAGKILTITDEIIVKSPKEQKDATLMYCDEGGLLSRNNPDQRQLPLRTAEAPEREIKETPAPATAPLRVVNAG